jgi:hypothetical protein
VKRKSTPYTEENNYHVPLESRRQRGDQRDEDESQVSADHVNFAVGEVDQLEHPVDERIPQRNERIAATDGDAVEEVLEEWGGTLTENGVH